MHLAYPTRTLLVEVPATYLVFDVLSLEGEDTRRWPYIERRRVLVSLDLTGSVVNTPPFWVDMDAATMLDNAREHHLEGVVAKNVDSTYQPGRRSPVWIKLPLRSNTEVIVAGWQPGTGPNTTRFESLILAAHDDTGGAGHSNLRNSQPLQRIPSGHPVQSP